MRFYSRYGPCPATSLAILLEQILPARNRALPENSARRPTPDRDVVHKSRRQLYGNFVMVDSAGECEEEDENQRYRVGPLIAFGAVRYYHSEHLMAFAAPATTGSLVARRRRPR